MKLGSRQSPIVYVLALSLAGAAFGQAPKYVSRVWRTQDGLPENKIRAIAQTPDGYLWVGTPSGLARFDGVRFVVYTRFNSPPIVDDNVRALTVARDGSLWIATDGGGLLQYQEGRFRLFGPNEGLANEFVTSVIEDGSGAIWAGTNRGLFRRHGQRFVRVDEPLRLRNIAFFGLLASRTGRVFAGGPSGLFASDKADLRPFDSAVETEEQIYLIKESRDGTLWLSTNHGLRVADGRTPASRRPNTRSLIGAIEEDRRGNMWFGTVGEGVFLMEDGQETTLRAPSALPDNNISAIVEDRERNIWVGTADGLVRLSAPDVSVLNSRDGLSEDSVVTVYRDRRGVLWLATVTGRMFRYVEARVSEFRLPPPANELRLRTVIEDRAGALWFGTDNQGVVRFANGAATRFTTREGLRNNGIQAFFEDRNGHLWIGTTSGLSRWDGSRFQNYYVEDGLSYGWIRCLAEDRNGDLLVGTDRGMSRFHQGKFVRDSALGQLSHDRVWSIFADQRNSLWIATRGAGLVRVRDGKVARLTTREGLLSNSIFQLIGDEGDRLWMSGPLGLSSAALADLHSAADGRLSSISVLSYGTGDGLESTQMNGGVQPAGAAASDGELWFPSVKGAVHFKPSHPRISHHSPVRIETVLVDRKTVPSTAEIVVGPGRHRVEIEFTSCSLRAPERVTFRYKLEPFDARWNTAAGPRVASYDNLPPGRYRFQVTARDGLVDAGVSEAAVAVVVRPYFYQTAWFYVLAFAAAAACAAGVLLFQVRQARQRYHLRLAERTRIAREMHDTVVQGCVGVSTLIEAAVGSSDMDQMLECLDNARIHLRLTLDEARQALSDLRHDSFENGLPGALAELAQTVSSERGIPVTLDVEGTPASLPDSTNRTLLLVTREAIRNAVTHGAPTAVSVQVCFGESDLRLEILDDGCGFATGQAHLAADGHFGILGMRERIEQIGGTLEISSTPGSGTTITACVPIMAAVPVR